MSEERKKVVLACSRDAQSALLSLLAGAELMAHETGNPADAYQCGKAAGFLAAARSMIEVAEQTLCRVIDHRAAHQAPPTPN